MVSLVCAETRVVGCRDGVVAVIPTATTGDTPIYQKNSQLDPRSLEVLLNMLPGTNALQHIHTDGLTRGASVALRALKNHQIDLAQR